MIAIPKSVLKSFRAMAKRLFGRARHESVWLSVVAAPEVLVLRAARGDAALEHRLRGRFEPAEFHVLLEQLAACEAKSPELVSFAPGAESVTFQWRHRGIPQQAFCRRPAKELPSHPARPVEVWSTDAGLLARSAMPPTRPIRMPAVMP